MRMQLCQRSLLKRESSSMLSQVSTGIKPLIQMDFLWHFGNLVGDIFNMS